jgi:hypothetical protein
MFFFFKKINKFGSTIYYIKKRGLLWNKNSRRVGSPRTNSNEKDNAKNGKPNSRNGSINNSKWTINNSIIDILNKSQEKGLQKN